MTAKPRIERPRNVAMPNRNRKLGRSSRPRGRTSAKARPIPSDARDEHRRLGQVVHEVREPLGKCSIGTRRPSESAERVV